MFGAIFYSIFARGEEQPWAAETNDENTNIKGEDNSSFENKISDRSSDAESTNL